MKHLGWMILLVAAFVTVGAAQETGIDAENIPSAEQLELYERGLEVQAREAQLDHERQIGELELAQRRAEIDRMRRGPGGRCEQKCGAFLLLILVTNILLTVWVFKDMHEQKIGRALWVPIVLLTGVFGAILYAIVRHTDIQTQPTDEST